VPSATVITLQSPRVPQALHVRGWLYHLLAGASKNVHDDEGPKPFSLAVGRAGGRAWIRVAFLDDDLAGIFAEALWSWPARAALPLRSGSARILEILEHSHPLSGKAGWGEILNEPPTTDLTLEFTTPTFFRRRGFNYPVPEPGLVLYSLAQKWNAHAPEQISERIVEHLTEGTTVRYLKGHTVGALAHERTVGFRGKVTYHVPNPNAEDALWLGRLGRLAFFSGVGAKTTLGFGLAKPVRRARSAGAEHGAGARGAEQARQP